MAQKLLKADGKRNLTAKKAVKDTENGSVVLVGTYREKQLDWIKKNSVCNYVRSATIKWKPDHAFVRQLFNHVSNVIGLANGAETDAADDSGRIALSLIPYVGGWRVEDGVYVNRRRRIFGVVAANEQGTNLVSFAVGIVIGCKGVKVYIVVGNEGDETRLGRIPKAFQPSIDVVTRKDFFNVVARRESAYQDLCFAIEDVRMKRKTEKEIP